MENFKKNIFITTTLPYCNGSIHVGAAFEFILADALNTHFKNIGHNTFFNIGLDQNGSKILAKSKELGISVDSYIKDITIDWKNSCTKLGIKYDNFYQTHTQKHSDKVQNTWKYFVENGDIYEKEYTAKYCTGCESFKLSKDLIDGKCQDHPTTNIDSVSETNFFFNLGKYRNKIYKWLETNPISESDKNELVKYLDEYDELSVSRTKSEFTFGIDVPDRDDQVIYVWLDALLNYYYACPDWENSTIIQLCGKDNLRFQAQIFQSFLASLGLKNTDKLLVHGTILDKDGRKISKTLGNVVDPIEQLEKYGIDAVRYYILAGLNTYSNSSWNEDELIRLFNSEICSGYGNLITRTLHLIDTKIEGNVISADDEFIKIIDNRLLIINSLWADFKVKEVCEEIYRLVQFGNKYINDTAPWNLDKPTQVLSNLYYLITVITKNYEPIFSEKCEEIHKAILNKKKSIVFSKIS